VKGRETKGGGDVKTLRRACYRYLLFQLTDMGDCRPRPSAASLCMRRRKLTLSSRAHVRQRRSGIRVLYVFIDLQVGLVRKLTLLVDTVVGGVSHSNPCSYMSATARGQ